MVHAKTYRFEDAQIAEHGQTTQAWHEFIRTSEFNCIASFLARRFSNALELGAGDGGQSVVISRFCDRLTCTELVADGRLGRFRDRNLPNVTYELCDATDLSRYPDNTFDLVFSSNMLEHIEDWRKCLRECKRVLAEDGIIVHVMPSRDWKLWNSVVRIVVRHKKPAIHGIASTNLAEFLAFGENAWIRKIESEGLKVDTVLRMPFYHGNGPIAMPVIRLGNQLGWKSSTAFVVTRDRG
jgi:ubiquinone/menaquinone biosynthesis C-methylase UbiE